MPSHLVKELKYQYCYKLGSNLHGSGRFFLQRELLHIRHSEAPPTSPSPTHLELYKCSIPPLYREHAGSLCRKKILPAWYENPHKIFLDMPLIVETPVNVRTKYNCNSHIREFANSLQMQLESASSSFNLSHHCCMPSTSLATKIVLPKIL